MALSKTVIANRRKWIKELRYGNRKQITGQLAAMADNSHEGFCCLGVACDIRDPKKKTWKPYSGGLPKKYQKIYGFNGFHSRADSPRLKQTDLTQLNDSERLSFPEIADVIELFTEAGM